MGRAIAYCCMRLLFVQHAQIHLQAVPASYGFSHWSFSGVCIMTVLAAQRKQENVLWKLFCNTTSKHQGYTQWDMLHDDTLPVPHIDRMQTSTGTLGLPRNSRLSKSTGSTVPVIPVAQNLKICRRNQPVLRQNTNPTISYLQLQGSLRKPSMTWWVCQYQCAFSVQNPDTGQWDSDTFPCQFDSCS